MLIPELAQRLNIKKKSLFCGKVPSMDDLCFPFKNELRNSTYMYVPTYSVRKHRRKKRASTAVETHMLNPPALEHTNDETHRTGTPQKPKSLPLLNAKS